MAMTDDSTKATAPPGEPPDDTGATTTTDTKASSGVGHDKFATMPRLQPEQTKGLGEAASACGTSRRQRRGMRGCGKLRKKGTKAVGRVLELRDEVKASKKETAAAAPGAERKRNIKLPFWLPILWVPVVVWLLSRIEKRFVAFLPGLLPISGFLAWFLAGVIEAAAWWLGRSMAARHEAYSITQLKDTERRALRYAVPLVVTIQAALLVLRLVRTGQLASSIALSAAALLLFAVSVWVHDMATDGPADNHRKARRNERRVTRKLNQANADYIRYGAQWRHTADNYIIEPAKAKVAAAAEIMMGIEALVRDRGREPDPWPVPLPVEAQSELAHGKLPPELLYPPLPDDTVTPTASIGAGNESTPELEPGP